MGEPRRDIIFFSKTVRSDLKPQELPAHEANVLAGIAYSGVFRFHTQTWNGFNCAELITETRQPHQRAIVESVIARRGILDYGSGGKEMRVHLPRYKVLLNPGERLLHLLGPDCKPTNPEGFLQFTDGFLLPYLKDQPRRVRNLGNSLEELQSLRAAFLRVTGIELGTLRAYKGENPYIDITDEDLERLLGDPKDYLKLTLLKRKAPYLQPLLPGKKNGKNNQPVQFSPPNPNLSIGESLEDASTEAHLKEGGFKQKVPSALHWSDPKRMEQLDDLWQRLREEVTVYEPRPGEE